jgi:hypothetical protein
LVCERSRQQVADLLQLKDPNIVTLVLSLIDGLILGRLYNEEVISFAEQGALLGKMLTAYLEKSLENHSSETFSSETLRYRDKVAL